MDAVALGFVALGFLALALAGSVGAAAYVLIAGDRSLVVVGLRSFLGRGGTEPRLASRALRAVLANLVATLLPWIPYVAFVLYYSTSYRSLELRDCAVLLEPLFSPILVFGVHTTNMNAPNYALAVAIFVPYLGIASALAMSGVCRVAAAVPIVVFACATLSSLRMLGWGLSSIG